MTVLRKALFLDRDGTLIRDAHYLKDPEKVEIIEEIKESLLRVKNYGYLLFLHTNQSGIARGYYDWSDVFMNVMQECWIILSWPSDFFNEIRIAPESPDEIEVYRKPSAKFEIEMTKKYNFNLQKVVVGDKWIDAQTGINAGMRGGLSKTGKEL